MANLYELRTMKYRCQPLKGHSVKRRATRTLLSVTQTEPLIVCAKCGRPCREAETKEAGWRNWSDGTDLHLICALCAHREFRPDAPGVA